MIFVVPARAKLNLDLRVVGRRDDGFHDVHTTFQAIDLHDLLHVERATQTQFGSEGFEIDNDDNSVVKAHRVVEHAAQTKLPVKMHLQKRIPPGSGMGGASADAAATLRALSTMFKLDIDLHALAEELGSDVPFFLLGGRARAEGRGERLMPLESTQTWFAIAWPGFALSTKDVYTAWDEVKGDGPNELRRAAERIDARVGEFAERLGPGWQMTGSGSAFFKSTSSEQEANDAVEDLACWTAVAAGMPRWT